MVRKSRAKNKTIGKCMCFSRDCTEWAEVRRIEAKRADLSRLYLVCHRCGIDDRQGEPLQRYIKDMAIFDDGEKQISAPQEIALRVPEVAPVAAPKMASEAVTKKPGFFETITNLLD